MKYSFLRSTFAATVAAFGLAQPAQAEDIDLFTTPAGGGTAPNVLIVLDNSANWNANNQMWAIGKQGEGELKAIHTLMSDTAVNTSVNLGLMMMQSAATGGNDSAYIRFHVRNMTPANKLALQELIGTAACTAGNNSLTGRKNCILKDFSSNAGQVGNATDATGEMTNSASTRYEGAMFEIFKYFGGFTNPANATTNIAGSPVDATHFGKTPFSAPSVKADPAAYSGGQYNPPILADGSNSCAKNFVIFIGNGYPSQVTAGSFLTGIGGNAAVPAPIGNKSNMSANWARYLFTTDVNELAGQQTVVTYTIDVYNAQPDANQNALLKGMAKFGGGRYFVAKNDAAIVAALREIIIEIQAVNSVFASASLPINATNRSQNENQVFIGMFRPDADAKPKWYGNLKQFQIALFSGDAALADSSTPPQVAVSASTGFIQACSQSFWTAASGNYWDFSSASSGSCTSVAGSAFSDLPDGGVVEKGGAAEVLRRGNNPSAAAPFTVSRTMKTCAAACGAMVDFNSTNVTIARTGAATAAEHTSVIDFTLGRNVLLPDGSSENTATSDHAVTLTEPRPSIHGDIAHSRPLPVNFGGTRKVVVYYGDNGGNYKAVEGATGKELWSFIAPEHHSLLPRLYRNTPSIAYPNVVIPGAIRKDYFFDGSTGLYQNLDNSRVWIYPTMRRGGRMLYAFDVTAEAPALKWALGCPNQGNDTDCTAGMTAMGQTWSGAQVAFVKGYNAGADPVVIIGGGYDACLDNDAAASTCTAASKGNKVFVIDANTGALLKTLDTDRPVVADVTLIDRDFDGMVDNAYVADALGSVYRIDFTNTGTVAALASGSWTITKVAYTNTGNRKLLFGPAALAVGTKVYLALGSGDRERPLVTNYPYTTPIQNRFYSFVDKFANVAFDLNGSTMENFSSSTTCTTTAAADKDGWFMDLSAGQGEQTVSSAVIFGGTIFFSTNRPVASTPGSCGTNLGEARGYALNLLNASGVIGTGKLCGGDRSGTFTGGGIPPSPVVGVVPVRQPDGTMKPTNVLIGGIDLDTGSGSPIGAQEPKVPLKQIRSRVYWYPHGDR